MEREREVTEELINAFKRVSGKENFLFTIADASLAAPDGTVREVVFPAVRGGEQTLRELVHEFKTKGPVYRRTVQTTLKASYTNHYRRGLIELLEVLEFRFNNTAHQPVIDALKLVKRYAKAGNTTYYPLGETTPEHKGTLKDWADLVYRTTPAADAAWRAWCTRWPPSRPCGSSCAARRSGSSAPTGGATRTRTCPPTSRHAAPSTTANCASPWTRQSSATARARR
ncbi:hypothetical protein ACBJ59_59045 [Nonomuraea sp. MTCD27]|uniref:hypothetical protein n=1 Tax=Nonomuraea sp. MTCD27 TaxID=1676747 RepID=UPI0035BF83FD